jgi:hypothetical protein
LRAGVRNLCLIFTPESIMKPIALPPVELLRALFDYDPESGKIYWKVSRGRVREGDEAGCLHCKGYRQIAVEKKIYKASRIAFALYFGEDPYPYEMDHINRDRADNRISNLRKVTVSENLKNKKARADGIGHKFITFDKRRKEKPYGVRIDDKRFGSFATLTDAIAVRDILLQTHFSDRTAR